MTDKYDEKGTREVRVARHGSARKVISAHDWRARTEAHAIEARLDALRARLRREVEAEVRAELADAFVRAAVLAERRQSSEWGEIYELIQACAKRLAEGELTADPRRMRDVVASVIEQSRESGPLAIIVHPDVREQFADVTAVAVREDDSLGPEDCVVEVRHGRFDGRLHTRAARLIRLLRETETRDHG